jgi:hypothetical protein
VNSLWRRDWFGSWAILNVVATHGFVPYIYVGTTLLRAALYALFPFFLPHRTHYATPLDAPLLITLLQVL